MKKWINVLRCVFLAKFSRERHKRVAYRIAARYCFEQVLGEVGE